MRRVDYETAFWELVGGRRSVRHYDSRPVADELVWRLLEAAHWAPSAHNRQPWRFVVMERGEVRSRLAAAMAERWLADLLADGVDAEAAARRAEISLERITSAPVVIVPCLDLTALDQYAERERQHAEWQMGVQSVALACQNLLLAVHHYGLAGCWMCAPIFCVPLVQEVLELPGSWQPQALLTIGYPPDEVARTRSREPLESRVVWR